MPDQASALNNLGRALALKGKTADALDYFAKAIRVNPSHVEAHCGLAYAFLTLTQTEQAISEFTEALRLKPNFQPAIDGLAQARKKKEQGP